MKSLLYVPFAIVLSILLLSNVALAAGEATSQLSTNSLAAQAGQSYIVTYTVFNNQNKDDVFSISVFPNTLRSITPVVGQTLLTIPAHAAVYTNITFNIPSCVASYSLQFTFAATSVTDKTVSSTTNLNLATSGYVTCMTSFGISKLEINPGETVKMTTSIQNLVASAITDGTLTIDISKDGKIVKSYTNTAFLPGEAGKEYSIDHTFDKYAGAGVYEVKATLKAGDGTILDQRATSMKINAVKYSLKDLPQAVTEKNYLLIKQFTVTFKNEGNVQTDAENYQVNTPRFMSLFFRAVTPISSVSKNPTAFIWKIPSLQPGETYAVQYKISFITWWTVGIAIALVALYIYMNFYSVNAIKTYSVKPGHLSKDKEISVALEIRNKGYAEINDLFIRDKVPNVVKLEDQFDTLKPNVRRVSDGLELTWRIHNMKPHEVRIMNYKVKPAVEILGTLNLPPVRVSFEGTKGKNVEIFSRPVTVMPIVIVPKIKTVPPKEQHKE